jgi:hypothetical protein
LVTALRDLDTLAPRAGSRDCAKVVVSFAMHGVVGVEATSRVDADVGCANVVVVAQCLCRETAATRCWIAGGLVAGVGVTGHGPVGTGNVSCGVQASIDRAQVVVGAVQELGRRQARAVDSAAVWLCGTVLYTVNWGLTGAFNCAV